MKHRLHIFTILALTAMTSSVMATDNYPPGGEDSHQSPLQRLPLHVQFIVEKLYRDCMQRAEDLYLKMPNGSKRDRWLENKVQACLTERTEHIEIEVQNMEAEQRYNSQTNDKDEDGDSPDARWTDNWWFSRQTKLLAPLEDATERVMEKTGRTIRSAGDGGGTIGGISRPVKALPGLRALPLR